MCLISQPNDRRDFFGDGVCQYRRLLGVCRCWHLRRGKKLLRLAVAMLGLQLTFNQLAGIGITGLMLAATVVVSTLIFTVWVGRCEGEVPELRTLITSHQRWLMRILGRSAPTAGFPSQAQLRIVRPREEDRMTYNWEGARNSALCVYFFHWRILNGGASYACCTRRVSSELGVSLIFSRRFAP